MCKIYYLLLLGLAFALVGCGGPEVEKVVGSVLLGGEPDAKLSVCLWPKSDINMGVLVDPRTDEDGIFEIFPDPAQGQKGKAGTYALLIHDHVFPPRFDKKFFSHETSPWIVEVGPGVTELSEFHLPKLDMQKQISAEIQRRMSRILE